VVLEAEMFRKPLILCRNASVLIVTMLLADQLVWRERAPLPQPRAGYMAGVVDRQLVIAGGSYWENDKKIWTSRVDLFDPAADSWRSGTPLPEPRSDSACISYKNALYVFGGGAGGEVRRDAMVFRGGKWSTLATATLPEPRIYSVAVEWRGSIFLVGGMTKATDYTTVKNSLWVWNPESPRAGWDTLPSLPGPGLISHSVAVMGGRIYVFGGATTGGTDVINLASVYRFNSQTREWARLPDLPIARRAWWAVSLPERILLLGGYSDAFDDEVFEYDPASGAFQRVGRLPHGICDSKFFRIGPWVIGTGGEAGNKIRGQWTFQAELLPKWLRRPR